jgi:transposase
MNLAPECLPNDVESLKDLVLQQAAQVEQLTAQNQHYQSQLEALYEELRLMRHKRFGPSSEKDPGQTDLFNEAEAAVEESEVEVEPAAESKPRKKPGRKPLPATLPRVEVVHDLAETDKVCELDGTPLKAIGDEVSEQLDIVPAKVQVIRHIRRKYACPCCQKTLKTAGLPPQPIPKSIASPGLLAQVAVSKYQDGLPLYRQEAILNRIGIDLPRATLAQWMIRMGDTIQPLINLLRDRLLAEDIIQMDETTVQVLKEPGKTATSKSYMWVQKGGPPDLPVILFDYDPSRGQQVPLRLLEGYQGYLQTDGYEGYAAVCAMSGILQVGCFAHARRKFDEAVKAQGKGGKAKAGKATKGLAYIQRLYRIETLIKDKSPEIRLQVRQQEAKPLLAEIRSWLDQSLPTTPPSSAVGKALQYLHNQWDKLIRYCDDGRLNIDNNPIERAIRPFVTGRKAWLFSDTVKGANASANLYSLIETAKANGLEPYRYLRHVFKELPAAQSLEDFEALLPGNLTLEQIKPVNLSGEGCS